MISEDTLEVERLKAERLPILADAQEALDAARKHYEEKKDEAKQAKEAVEARQDHMNSIVKELRDLERGVFDVQPRLPFKS